MGRFQKKLVQTGADFYMKVLQKYFRGEILRSVFFVLVAFLALFAFFDLINELKSVGRGGYQLQYAFLYVLMEMPEYTYELMPIAALIGTIWTLAQFASRSEYTIMRVSGLSPLKASWMLTKIGLIFVIITFVFGELIAPKVSAMAERMKLRVQGSSVSQEFRSGLWAKDVIRQNGLTGNVIGSRFVNVKEVQPDGELRGVKLYEFDQNFHLISLITAARADYEGAHKWQLLEVTETHFPDFTTASDWSAMDTANAVLSKTMASKELVSEITPDILSVLFADPDRMSTYDLAAYTKHLAENNQHTERYEIAFWKKLVYPFVSLVMMALALPFAYMQVRSGGISLKIFIGIMIGVSFQLLNSLFSHLGLLNTWPPLATAVLPSLFFLLLAVASLWWIERH
jgi:lipopolysaccharide export system permease protein